MPIVIPAPSSILRVTTANQLNARIVFFGTPQFAVPALRTLHRDRWPIAAVVTAPDQPIGRQKALTPSTVKVAAMELGLQVHTPATLRDDAFWTTFSNLRPDLCIVVAYGKLIPKRYLDIPRLGFLNIHPSLLPLYRGPSPIPSAILDGQTSTGVSIMQLDDEMDHGPVVAQEPWVIPGIADTPFCENELSRIGADLLARILPEYIAGTRVPRPQDHTQATFTKKFVREDGRLDWTQSADRIVSRVRALTDNPGTWTLWNGKTLNILRASTTAGGGTPGRIVRSPEGIGISCQKGILILELVQPEGGKAMDAKAFVNGHPEFIGSEVV